MSDETSTRPGGWLPAREGGKAGADALTLVIAWSHAEPARVGESVRVPRRGPCVIGRGGARAEDPGVRLFFAPERPSAPAPSARPLTSGGLSRTQLVIETADGRLRVASPGRAPLRVRGLARDHVEVAPGDVLEIERELLLLCVERPASISGGARPAFAFGDPDAFGFVGEGSRAWALRDRVAHAARRPGHVLITGPSGAGKELTARAVHALSSRAAGPYVSRSAATLPEGIIDAELFGNARNYPNAGMRERPGLLGEADGGTLFLDEIGELPEALQAHLLRVLDDGEYHRLGEDRSRRADLRVIAATNRPTSALKHDLAARFKIEVPVPGFDERRDDIPLLVRHVLRRLASGDPEVRARFFEGGEPRVDPQLVAALLAHTWTTHVRELESLLLLSLAESDAHFVALTRGVERKMRSSTSRDLPSQSEVEEALRSTAGNVSRAFRVLGLPTRDALNRLIKKYGIVVKR